MNCGPLRESCRQFSRRGSRRVSLKGHVSWLASTLHTAKVAVPYSTRTVYVFGVNSAGATTFFQEPAYVVSAIYPCLPIGVKLTRRFGEEFKLQFNSPLVHLIETGLIKSDGSHRRIRLVAKEKLFRVDPLIAREDLDAVFEDVHGLLEGRPARLSEE